ncbi:hypothetical protein N7499_009978 [Penicillium canescens]|uniref:Zn(2)-C6 fungal-type domain-containing protein n=1 Tax=Penicillium canescens TaxID=5083 RepID=A0AAD6IMH7_PENCN|nr:uncharacterized protein N7446_008004 [Penicillium canescens]KAJ6018840.1 hypothetical protein N7522_000907 [Penicillium canescens]KAJ6033702.1 hypothetical protein N7444_011473 [Penicillium canescens]KAJ6057105.1 hypothetical protein N7460_000379 [Penicillium canescens]KAJ6058421.1 hypothetical protein N7446_008004 [Penicillium canescens]KAJ6071964.1 hypothetical protein N7499_009978 [Penicillium canescens]
MALDKQAPVGQELRKRRAHTKSRQGCRNCKIRRVKCDETRPQCQKCMQYGVSCNYTAQAQGQTPDLLAWQTGEPNKPENNRARQIVFNAKPIPKMLLLPITVGNGPDSFILDIESQARLYRFQTRTLPTIGTPKMSALYQRVIIGLALPHPFLMHTILGITATHDRLSLTLPSKLPSTSTSPPPITHKESHHRQQAAKNLIKKLSTTVNPQDRDALWAAAALLGVTSLTSIESTTPQETWPLKNQDKPPDLSDLQWMNLTKGKEAIWKVTNPLRPDSVFHILKDEYRDLTVDPGICAISELKVEFVDVFNLADHDQPHGPSIDINSTGENENGTHNPNPYLKAISILTRLRGPECRNGSIPRDLAFISFMEGSFRRLLQVKDLRALLLLAYWYAPLCRDAWFIARRAWLECRAICLYLEIVCADGDEEVLGLVGWPREMCGLD